MLKNSVQSTTHLPQGMHLPPRGLQGTANLFSFLPTDSSSSTTESSEKIPSLSAPITALASTASTGKALRIERLSSALSSDPTSSCIQHPHTSINFTDSNPGVLSGGAGQSVPVRETGVSPFDHVDWEAGVLLGGQEEIDETSLRMEMKTSMDIHRLMRSRQKVCKVYMLLLYCSCC